VNIQKVLLNRKKNYQAGNPSKFLALMIPKAEESEIERRQYTGVKIKLLLSHTSGEHSEHIFNKIQSHIYCELEISYTFITVPLSINWQILQGKSRRTPQ